MLSRLFFGAFSTAEHVVVANLEFTRVEVVELGMPLLAPPLDFMIPGLRIALKLADELKFELNCAC